MISPGDAHVVQQPQNRRQLESDGDAAYVAVVGRHHFHFPFGEKGDGFLPGDDAKRLVGSVEEKGLLHELLRLLDATV